MTGLQPLLRSSEATINGVHYRLVAFYFPGHPTPWDKFYGYEALANFYVCPAGIKVDIHGVTGQFHNSEAAFQATKWWSDKAILQAFEKAQTGDDAFRLKRSLEKGAKSGLNPAPDYHYAGLGQIGAMAQVLAGKFTNPLLANILAGSGEAYLLEHNETTGRDDFWSDNYDGTGQNMLGISLMTLRKTLGGSGPPPGNYAVADFTKQVKQA